MDIPVVLVLIYFVSFRNILVRGQEKIQSKICHQGICIQSITGYSQRLSCLDVY